MPPSKGKAKRPQSKGKAKRASRAVHVLSIGYEGHLPESFVEKLMARDVKRLVDVRALPFSRKKGFSKNPLRQMLEANGIEYVHCRAAGNPFREMKEASLPVYAAHLAEHPEIVEEFMSHVPEGGPTAVLCYERDEAQCHRSILLQAVRDAGWKISVARSE